MSSIATIPWLRHSTFGTGERRRGQNAMSLVITTVAGEDGTPGYSGDGGPATAAQLYGPYGVALGPDGALYIAGAVDDNYRIRRVGPDGIITTVAGVGTPGYSGDGGPATAAHLHTPYGVTLGPDNTLYIAERDNRSDPPRGTRWDHHHSGGRWHPRLQWRWWPRYRCASARPFRRCARTR